MDIKELEDIFNKQKVVYENMEIEIENKKKFIIEGNIDNLGKSDDELIKLISTINKLETRKQQIKNKLESEFSQNESYKKRLLNFEKEIKEKTKKISRQNKVTMDLLTHSLKLVEGSVNLILNSAAPELSGYSSRGKVKNNHTNAGISSVIEDV